MPAAASQPQQLSTCWERHVHDTGLDLVSCPVGSWHKKWWKEETTTYHDEAVTEAAHTSADSISQ